MNNLFIKSVYCPVCSLIVQNIKPEFNAWNQAIWPNLVGPDQTIKMEYNFIAI